MEKIKGFDNNMNESIENYDKILSRVTEHEKKYNYGRLSRDEYIRQDIKSRKAVDESNPDSKEIIEKYQRDIKTDSTLKDGICVLPNFIRDDLCDYFVDVFEMLDLQMDTNKSVYPLWNGNIAEKDPDGKDQKNRFTGVSEETAIQIRQMEKQIKDAQQINLCNPKLLQHNPYSHRIDYYYSKISEAACKYINKFQPWNLLDAKRLINGTNEIEIKRIHWCEMAVRDQFDPSYILCKRYQAPDQGYHAFHADWHHSSDDLSLRHWVVMCYLNDVEEGGETEFIYQDKKIKPEKGTVIVFPPYYTHMHKGHPPKSGSKYILTSWLMPRRYGWQHNK